jgi:hypothetical protein
VRWSALLGLAVHTRYVVHTHTSCQKITRLAHVFVQTHLAHTLALPLPLLCPFQSS